MSPRPLSRLSDHNLLSSLEQLVRRERARVVEILDHLDEVDRRRLYRDMGHSSLFAYCTGRLRFSESVAGRRIAAARALRRAPGARGMLESGDVSVTTLVVGEAFMRALEECRGLVATPQNLNPTLEEVFAAVMEVFLEKKSPARRARRREERRRDREKRTQGKDRDGEGTSVSGGKAASTGESLPAQGVNHSRHVTAATRDAVWVRDGGRCTWVGPSGKRCGETRGLEVDHVHPFGMGGIHAEDNLRLLCRAHNTLAAERAYGRDTIARYARRE